MENFKKKLVKSQIYLIFGLLAACGALAYSSFYSQAEYPSEHMRDNIMGFRAGMATALIGILLFLIIRNIAAVRNEGLLKKLYISETDERKQFIIRQSGSAGMNIVMYGLAAGAVIAGSINITVFFTLLASCLFVSFVRVFFKVYYKLKY